MASFVRIHQRNAPLLPRLRPYQLRTLSNIFLGDMLQLNKGFPEIYKQVIVGNFAAQLSSDELFCRIETDKVIEMTLNEDTKTPGGTTAFLTNVGAVQRWELNA